MDLVTVHRVKVEGLELPKEKEEPIGPVMSRKQQQEFLNFATRWR